MTSETKLGDAIAWGVPPAEQLAFKQKVDRAGDDGSGRDPGRLEAGRRPSWAAHFGVRIFAGTTATKAVTRRKQPARRGPRGAASTPRRRCRSSRDPDDEGAVLPASDRQGPAEALGKPGAELDGSSASRS